MQIIKNFGIDPGLLITQVVNFLIILYLLKRFLYKPVMSMMRKREDTIKQGLVDAQNAQLKLEETLKKQETMLDQAKQQANAILEDATFQARESAKEIEQKAKQHSEAMLTEAKKEIQRETQRAEKQLSEHVMELATKMLEKSLKTIFADKKQDDIITETIKKFKKIN